MASESRKSTEKTGKTFDVSKPGKSVPSSTSRPAIIGHHTLLQDPMVTPSAEPKADTTIAVKTNEKKLLVPSEEVPTVDKVEEEKTKKTEKLESEEAETTKKEKPVLEAKEPEATEEKPEEAKESDVAEEKPVEKTEEPVEKTEEPAKEEAVEPEDANTNEDTEEDPAKPPGEKDAEANKKLEEELAKAAALEKLVTDKTYYAPIGVKKMKKSKHNRVVWVVLVILLALVLGDLLIDSGMIETNIQPPIRFFNNG